MIWQKWETETPTGSKQTNENGRLFPTIWCLTAVINWQPSLWRASIFCSQRIFPERKSRKRPSEVEEWVSAGYKIKSKEWPQYEKKSRRSRKPCDSRVNLHSFSGLQKKYGRINLHNYCVPLISFMNVRFLFVEFYLWTYFGFPETHSLRVSSVSPRLRFMLVSSSAVDSRSQYVSKWSSLESSPALQRLVRSLSRSRVILYCRHPQLRKIPENPASPMPSFSFWTGTLKPSPYSTYSNIPFASFYILILFIEMRHLSWGGKGFYETYHKPADRADEAMIGLSSSRLVLSSFRK